MNTNNWTLWLFDLPINTFTSATFETSTNRTFYFSTVAFIWAIRKPSITPLQTCQCEVTKNSNNFFVHVKDCPIRKFALEKLVCIWLYFCWVSENMINSHTHTRYSLPIEWNGRKKGFFRPFHSMYIQYIVSPFLPRHGWFIVSYDTYYKNSSLERQESGLALEHIPTSGSSDFFLYFFNNYLKRKPSHNYSHCFVISFNIIL